MTEKIETERIKGVDLKPGMYVHTWCGTHRIVKIRPYTGPYDFICGIMIFPGVTGMSIEKDSYYDVVVVRDG